MSGKDSKKIKFSGEKDNLTQINLRQNFNKLMEKKDKNTYNIKIL